MPKKILICEDNAKIAELIAEKFVRRGYDAPTVVFEEKGCLATCIAGDIERAVLKEQPDYLVIDGLNGLYDCAAETAIITKPSIIPIIFTAEDNLIKAAKEKGYAAFKKPDATEMFNFIRSYDKSE